MNLKTLSILTVLLIIFSAAHSQRPREVRFYLIPETVEEFTGNSEYISNDPLNQEFAAAGKVTKQIDRQQQVMPGLNLDNLGIDIETVLSPRSMFVRLPVKYSWDRFRFNLSVPYYFKREMSYAAGKKSSSGIGDALLRTSYFMYGESYLNEIQLNLKLPTGDENNTVDGHLVPLGTGSTDIFIANNLSYFSYDYQIQASVSYRINGAVERLVEVYDPENEQLDTVSYDVSNGKTFIFNGSYIRYLMPNLSLIGGLSATINQEGSMDIEFRETEREAVKGSAAGQDFTFLDIIPAVSYNIFDTDLVLSLQIPVITERSSDNDEEDRSVGLFFRLSRNIF